ncbi:MAG TPA: hypothetical protein VGD92_05180, partial [Sphingobacteriaceae bacterium]
MTNVKNLSDYDLKPNTLETALYTSPDPIVVLETSALKVTFGNHALFSFLGKKEDVTGRQLPEILPGAENVSFVKKLREVMDSGKAVAD